VGSTWQVDFHEVNDASYIWQESSVFDLRGKKSSVGIEFQDIVPTKPSALWELYRFWSNGLILREPDT